ncbi:MAG: N-acetylmuramoyl-L-alanine amidase, partial [Actinomycetota bacterium]|nr:N-acetylmuramoyl-L-alanine amidase [Actinomycetota bacterium]
HCNSSINTAAQGVETYWSTNGGAGSSQFATSIHNAVVSATGRPSRIVRSSDFKIVKYTTMTSALVECGFLSNPEEAALLNNADFQNRIAQGIVNGVHAYVNSSGITGSTGTPVATGTETLTGDVLINIDTPKNDEAVGGVISLQGWAIDKSATVTSGVTAIHVYDGPANGPGNLVGIANYGINRQDVANKFGKANLAPCGFNLQIDTNKLSKGTHVLHIYAHNEAVGWKYSTVRINVVNDGSPVSNTSTQTTTTQQTTTQTNTAATNSGSVSISGPRKTVINIDTPKSGTTINGSFTLSGWAVETASTTSSGITAIHIYDGPANGEGNFLTAATYGISRPDVATYYGKSNFKNSGFSANISLNKLSNGNHTLYVYAYNQDIGWKYATVNIAVGSGGGSVQTAGISQVNTNSSSNSSNTSANTTSQSVTTSGSKVIMINVDTPKSGSGVSGNFEISGWAADKNSASGTGINMVHIYDGPANGAQNMLGVATYGLARKDVSTAFGNGNLTNSGFKLSVSGSRLANGNHTLYIYANNPELGWKYTTVNITIGGSSATGATATGGAAISGGTNIVGYVPVSVDQLLRPFINRGSGQIDRARRLADLYIRWGQAFNIRADIAWAQMCHETGFLEFTGVAKADWNNFAGVGVTGPGAVVTFASEELGIVAHYAHLAWYVYPNHVNGYCSSTYDPRHIGAHRFNGDSSINCLNGRWAPAADYANKIIAFASQIWQ